MPAVDLAEGSKDRTKPNAVQTSGPALEAASAAFGTTNSKMLFTSAARSSSLFLVSGPTALAPLRRWANGRRADGDATPFAPERRAALPGSLRENPTAIAGR